MRLEHSPCCCRNVGHVEGVPKATGEDTGDYWGEALGDYWHRMSEISCASIAPPPASPYSPTCVHCVSLSGTTIPQSSNSLSVSGFVPFLFANDQLTCSSESL